VNWMKDVLNLTVLILALLLGWMMLDMAAKDLSRWDVKIEKGGKP
jgi:hypothetical protein